MQDETDQKTVRIEHLAEHTDAGHGDAVLTLASWIQEEWGHSFLEMTFDHYLCTQSVIIDYNSFGDDQRLLSRRLIYGVRANGFNGAVPEKTVDLSF